VAIAALCLAPRAAAADAPAAAAEAQETRETMGRIFEAMRFLLPLSLEAERFEDPARRERVGEALALLERSAAELSLHAESQELSFLHLARTLAADARDVRERWAEGYVREARQLVQIMTETCIACHSRLPAERDAPRSEAFLRDEEVERLPLEGRAKLAYATRNFAAAVVLYERLLAAPPPSATWLDHEGYLDDYLELSIRVRRDWQRPVEPLAAFARRGDLSPSLAEEVARWRSALERLRSGSGVASLEEVQALVGRSADAADPRDWLVEYLQASGFLHARLEQGIPTGERARAYELLGVLESRIGRSFWLSQAEAFLEAAIRLAPGTPVAARAYELLDDALVAGYASRDSELPPDIQRRLDELREVAGGRPTGGAVP